MLLSDWDELKSRFFLYTGKVNAVALNTINDRGERKFFDQHGVCFYRADIDRWEEQGILKIYCPSFLIAFRPGEDYKKLNELMGELEPLLDQNMPFH